jgi:hypothetical protein
MKISFLRINDEHVVLRCSIQDFDTDISDLLTVTNIAFYCHEYLANGWRQHF